MKPRNATLAAIAQRSGPQREGTRVSSLEPCPQCGALLLFATDLMGWATQECTTCKTGPCRIMPYHPSAEEQPPKPSLRWSG